MKKNKKSGFIIQKIIIIIIFLFILAFLLDYFGIDIRALVEKIGLKDIIVSIWNFGVYLWVEYIWWFVVYIWDIFADLINKLKN